MKKGEITVKGTDVKIALIPAYKPGAELLPMLRQLTEQGFAPIVVDDGSGEEYNNVFEKAAFYGTVLAHGENRGKGAALKTGLRHISETFAPPYCVVTLDADGQHSIEDAVRVCRRADELKQSLVLGCREFKGEGVKVPKKSLFGNKITRTVFRLSSGMDVSDTQTGLRAFSDRHIARLCEIPGERYEYEMNMLMEYARDGLPIEEVPIKTVYIDNNSSSHFDPIHDSFRIYKEILKFSASSFVSFLLDYGLYCLFSLMTGSLLFSNVTARLFSAAANYELNRRIVFAHKGSAGKSAVQYFVLAGFILLFNTLLLDLLAAVTPLGRFSAKIVTEICMFTLSWTIQKTVIFKRKDAEAR